MVRSDASPVPRPVNGSQLGQVTSPCSCQTTPARALRPTSSQVAQHQPGVAQHALRPGQPGPAGPPVAGEPEHREAEHRDRAEQPGEQRDRRVDAQPQRVVRRGGAPSASGATVMARPRAAAAGGGGPDSRCATAAARPARRRTARTGRLPSAPRGGRRGRSTAVSRSSIIVAMSMNGLTVIRLTRSPSIRRSRLRPPGSADEASVSSVEMPEVAVLADVAPQVADPRVGQRGLLRQQPEQRLLDRGPQLRRAARASAIRLATRSGEVEELEQPVVADQRGQRAPLAGVVAQQVADASSSAGASRAARSGRAR